MELHLEREVSVRYPTQVQKFQSTWNSGERSGLDLRVSRLKVAIKVSLWVACIHFLNLL